ncbi:MAG: 50S ribosomal protein L35 [Chloroflexi bacterium]|nr:50S ribosomal protein L35 [Chloroflexota bacterium]
MRDHGSIKSQSSEFGIVAKKYKMKSHKSTAKRFRMTATGLVLRTKGGKTHFRRRRSRRSKQALDKMLVVTNVSFAKRIKRLAPYMSQYKAHPPA